MRRTETLQMSGIRCERCVGRLAAALQDHVGLERASANLIGEVTLSWDDERTDRDSLIVAMARAGFRPEGSQPDGRAPPAESSVSTGRFRRTRDGIARPEAAPTSGASAAMARAGFRPEGSQPDGTGAAGGV